MVGEVGNIMAKLDIELNKVSSVKGSIKNAKTQLSKRKSDYDGIIKDVNKISSNSGNLANCNTYLRKKNQQLQGKIDKLDSFNKKISDFETNAKSADKKVATYVKDESNTFYKTIGIKTGWAAGWDNLKKGATKVWDCVKDFYEKHKFVIDFIVDVALLAVAVVSLIAAIPTGGATLFFAGFALATALGDMVGSSVALGYHIAGDDEKAGVWADRGLKDGMQYVGGLMDDGIELLTGKSTNFFEGMMGFSYDVISIASVGYGLFKSGKSLFKALKNKNFRQVKLKGVKTLFGLNLAPGESKKGYKAICKAFSFIKNGKQAYNLVRVTSVFKNLKTTYNLADSIFKGTFMTDGIKIVKDIKGAWDNMVDATRTFKSTDFKYLPYLNPYTPIISILS